eukprot:2939339-Rhodomonas_salina.1
MLEILGADVDDSTRTKLLMLYLKHATPCVMDCFAESDVFNENWPDLAKLLHALLPDDSPQPADSKLQWKSQQARLSKSLFPGLMEKEVVQWSEAFAQNAIVVHKILTLQWEIEMLQPALAGSLLSAHPLVRDAIVRGSNFDIVAGAFNSVPVTRDAIFRIEQLINALPPPFSKMPRGAGNSTVGNAAMPVQNKAFDVFTQQIEKMNSEIAGLKREREPGSAPVSFQSAQSGTIKPLANITNINNSKQVDDLMHQTQKQAKELEELKRLVAAKQPAAPAVVALQDLRSVFENFSPGAGAGGKECLGGSGWNRYASMDPHRVRYTYRDDPEDL